MMAPGKGRNHFVDANKMVAGTTAEHNEYMGGQFL
jgi:hypothetical protein